MHSKATAATTPAAAADGPDALSAMPAAGFGATRSAALPLIAGALAAASFVAMDATIKALSARYGVAQLSFFRFASGPSRKHLRPWRSC